MTKAILVIDMPKSCSECPIFNSDFYTCQLVFGELYEETRKGIRHERCPLKPMPEKKPISQDRGKNHCEYSLLDRLEYQKGFNDCIDEILEKTK